MFADSISVADLLVRARAQGGGDMELLFTACRNYLSLMARAQVESWLQAKYDASDLVQQTLLEAYRDFVHFRGATEGEWLAWLRQILTRNAANLVRHYHGAGKRQVGRERPLAGADPASGAVGFVPQDPGESPSQQLLRRERELQMADALAQLPEDYRDVILLRNLQRLSFDQVAERMGRSRPAAQMLWTRALAKLQQILKVMQGPSSGEGSQ